MALPLSEELVSSGAVCSCPGYVQDSCLRQRGEVGISCAAAQLLQHSTAQLLRCAAAQFPALRCTAAVHSCAAGLPPSPPPLPRVKPIYRAGQLKENSTECRQPIMYGLIESRMSWVDRPTQLHTTTIQKTWSGYFLVWYDLVQRYDVGPRKTMLSADMVNVMVCWVWYDATP